MTYDSSKHHRRSIRLRGYDYGQASAYFVTICVRDRECLFGNVVDDEMRPNGFGETVVQCWYELLRYHHTVDLDEFVVMPNHIHGIVVVTGPVGAGSPRPSMITPGPGNRGAETAPLRRPTLGRLVAFFKYQSTKCINETRGTPGTPVWQRNYYEHIIRNERSLQQIREYIATNPAMWQLDQLHPDNPSKW